MTEQEIIELGNQAQTLLQDDAFNDLYLVIIDDIAKEILATKPTQSVDRELLYNTFSGLRTFKERLNSYRLAKDSILAIWDEDHDEQFRSDMDDNG